jgi:hypothetical protein
MIEIGIFLIAAILVLKFWPQTTLFALKNLLYLAATILFIGVAIIGLGELHSAVKDWTSSASPRIKNNIHILEIAGLLFVFLLVVLPILGALETLIPQNWRKWSLYERIGTFFCFVTLLACLVFAIWIVDPKKHISRGELPAGFAF